MRTLAAGITAEERDALHQHILSDLTGVDDLRLAFQGEDFERASRLGIEFGDELRLMEDLGWGSPITGAAITLTMPPQQLRRVFTRLRADVERLRQDEEREEAEVEDQARDRRERAKRITQACGRVLSAVGDIPSSESEGEVNSWG